MADNPPADPYLDTDIIIRLLTSDDVKKQQAAAKLFEQVEKGELLILAPDTVIADTVYVLSSPRLYHFPRVNIHDTLSVLLKLPNFKVDNKQAIIKALDLYVTHNIDFSDAFLAALTLQTESKIIF